jgi:hypothetical protein
MACRRSSRIAIALLAVLALGSAALPADGTAKGAVGVEKVSRAAGEPGDPVRLTLGCGFCYPPCEGEPGHRNGPCMLGTRMRPPPASFPVSLIPAGLAPDPTECGPGPGCSPTHAGPPVVAGPPARAPYTLLGEALPPAGIEAIRDSGRSYVPRYRLEFEIPARIPGRYAFVIFCDACWPRRGGALISLPTVRSWRIRIDPPLATFRPLAGWLPGFLQTNLTPPPPTGRKPIHINAFRPIGG